jgi:translation initiation factor 2B subunit (eIF-2B alpha/beta/delta family)
MILAREIQDRIASLRHDSTSGATALAHAASEIMCRVVDLSRDVTPVELKHRIIAAGKAIVKGQPAVAALYTLVNGVLGALDDSRDATTLSRAIQDRVRRFSKGLISSAASAARHAASLVTDGSVVLTHSRSSLVESALLGASRAGVSFSVICTESRPLGEGRKLAESLASEGISTTIVVDAAVPSFIRRSTLVMLGADALSVHGLVNKIGTSLIAMSARNAAVPVYVIATTVKFLPPNVPLSYQQIKNPQDIVPERISNLAAVNLYFDFTPLDQVKGCVTEAGIVPNDRLRELLSSWQVEETLDLEACG